MKTEIVDLSRGHITLRIGERTATIEGELLVKGPGIPDFVAFSDTLKRWDPPKTGTVMTEEERMVFLAELLQAGKRRELEIEIDVSTG
jgi:hypothetical protein